MQKLSHQQYNVNMRSILFSLGLRKLYNLNKIEFFYIGQNLVTHGVTTVHIVTVYTKIRQMRPARAQAV